MVKQILLILLLFFILFFSLWVIYGLLTFLFRRDELAMYIPSFNKHIRLMRDYLTLIPGKKLVDLGCGDGKAMRFFARTFGLQCDGYEIQYFPYIYGKILNKLLGYPNLNLIKKNFILVDISEYDYIYLYLLPKQMILIEDRIFKIMKSDAIIISNSFQFAFHTPYKIIKDTTGKPSIFLYKK